MAKVYTGKVVIQVDDMDSYIKALHQAEELRKPFRNHLENLSNDFAQYLENNYSRKTVRKHIGIVNLFIDFLCRYTDVDSVGHITRGMVNTHFRKWWKRKVWDSTTENELRVALKKFFCFLSEEKNITNEKILIALKA